MDPGGVLGVLWMEPPFSRYFIYRIHENVYSVFIFALIHKLFSICENIHVHGNYNYMYTCAGVFFYKIGTPLFKILDPPL